MTTLLSQYIVDVRKRKYEIYIDNFNLECDQFNYFTLVCTVTFFLFLFCLEIIWELRSGKAKTPIVSKMLQWQVYSGSMYKRDEE